MVLPKAVLVVATAAPVADTGEAALAEVAAPTAEGTSGVEAAALTAAGDAPAVKGAAACAEDTSPVEEATGVAEGTAGEGGAASAATVEVLMAAVAAEDEPVKGSTMRHGLSFCASAGQHSFLLAGQFCTSYQQT